MIKKLRWMLFAVAVLAVALGGGAGALPKAPLDCEIIPGHCTTTTTTCPPPGTNVQKAPAGQPQQPCQPKTIKSCTPSKKVCHH
jgi:hypothetical protein